MDSLCRAVRIAPLLLLSFSACNKSDSLGPALERNLQLQSAFNSSCKSFAEMAETGPKALATKEWVSGCEQLHHTLGRWQSLASVQAPSSQLRGPTVLLQGRAGFANGGPIQWYRYETYWHVHGSEARLYYFYLEGGGKEFAIPSLPPRPFPKLNHEKRDLGEGNRPMIGSETPKSD